VIGGAMLRPFSLLPPMRAPPVMRTGAARWRAPVQRHGVEMMLAPSYLWLPPHTH
jgi:hypothetical protein